MSFNRSVHDQELFLSPPNNHNNAPPQPYQSPISPISPDTPDTIEKSNAPLMSYHRSQKPPVILSTQFIDDLSENADFYTLNKRDAVSSEQHFYYASMNMRQNPDNQTKAPAIHHRPSFKPN